MMTVLTAGLPNSAMEILRGAIDDVFSGAVEVRELTDDILRSRVRLSSRSPEVVLVVLDKYSAEVCQNIESGLYSSDKYYQYVNDNELVGYLNTRYNLNIKLEVEEVLEDIVANEDSDEISRYLSIISRKEDTIKNLEQRILYLQDLYGLSEDVSSLGNFDELKSKNEELSAKIYDLEELLKIRNSKIADLELDLNSLKSIENNSQNSLNEVSKKYDEVVLELESLKEKISQQSEELLVKVNEVGELRGREEVLVSVISDKDNEILKLGSSLDEKDDIINSLRIDIDEFTKNISSLEKSISEANHENFSILSNLDIVKNENNALKTNIFDLENKNENLNNKVLELVNEVSNLEGISEALNNDIVNLKNENSILVDDINRLRSENSNLKTNNKRLEIDLDTAHKLTTEKELGVSKDIEDLKSLVGSLKSENMVLKDSVDTLSSENKELHSRILNDDKSLFQLNKEKIDLQNKISLLEKSTNVGGNTELLLKEIQELQDKIASMSSNIFTRIGISLSPVKTLGVRVLPNSRNYSKIKFAYSGSAESRKGTYKCLFDECASCSNSKNLIVDLVSETSIDYVFQVKKTVSGLGWFQNGGSLDNYLSSTGLPNTMVLSTGIGYINDSYFLNIDWESRLHELENSGYNVILYCGDISNTVGRVLHESFASCGESVIYVIGNAVGSRTVVTNLRGITNNGDSVVAYFDFNPAFRKFYDLVSKTNRCKILSTKSKR